jgi:hypothetical protein
MKTEGSTVSAVLRPYLDFFSEHTKQCTFYLEEEYYNAISIQVKTEICKQI